MPAVRIVRALLVANTGVTDVVPAERIKAGILPQGTALPAIGIMQISRLDRHVVKDEGKLYATARVQVTVMADAYPAKKDVLKLVRDALPASTGLVDGITMDSIMSDIEGPDLDDPETSIYTQSRDYIVKFIE